MATATAPGRLAGLVGLSARSVVDRVGDWLGVGRATPWPWRRCHETGSGWRVRWGYGCLLQRRTATATSTAAGRRVGRAGALGSSVVARAWVTARRRRHQGGSRGSSGSRRVGWSAGTETGSGSAAPPLGRGAVATRRALDGEFDEGYGCLLQRRTATATSTAAGRRVGRAGALGSSVVARAWVTARRRRHQGGSRGSSGSRRVGWSAGTETGSGSAAPPLGRGAVATRRARRARFDEGYGRLRQRRTDTAQGDARGGLGRSGRRWSLERG
jgi:hypothetical protein